MPADGPSTGPRRSGGDEREIEAALADLVRLKDGPRDDAYRAEKDAAWDRARAALDRVRGVRDDNVHLSDKAQALAASHSIMAGVRDDNEDGKVEVSPGRRPFDPSKVVPQPRFPQGEDHEAERLRADVRRWEERFDRWQSWRMFEAAELARGDAVMAREFEAIQGEDHEPFAPSPERDTEKLVEALRQIADCTLIVNEDGERWIDTEMPMRMAREALAEFTASKADETPEEKRSEANAS